jgi:secondary thiamine-phosphate synthase enzyme
MYQFGVWFYLEIALALTGKHCSFVYAECVRMTGDFAVGKHDPFVPLFLDQSFRKPVNLLQKHVALSIQLRLAFLRFHHGGNPHAHRHLLILCHVWCYHVAPREQQMSATKSVRTTQKKQVLDITEDINEYLSTRDVSDGLCHVFALHTTCSTSVADLDPGTDLDMLDAFEAMIPKLHFRHPHNPAHVPDHIMSSIIGPGTLLPVAKGELMLGTWQRVVLIELDGPRERKVRITIIKA